MVTNRRALVCLLCLCGVLIASCDKKEKLQGKREEIPGVAIANVLERASPGEKALIITPSEVVSMDRHVCVMGNKQHRALNYKMPKRPNVLWKYSLGSSPILSNPVAFGGKVYAIDANGVLSCVSQKDGKIIWKKVIAKQPEDGVFSGGITAENDIIYVGTNIGTVVAIDAKKQKEIWVKELKVPVKGVPLCIAGKVIVTLADNQTLALNKVNGEIVWTKIVNSEQTVMCESSSPAVFDKSVICAYSSGDVVSFYIDDGANIWNDVLFSANIFESGSVISHIAASPVVCEKMESVLVATTEGKIALIDAFSGIRIWEQEIGTISTPVVVGDWAFVLHSDGTVTCLSLKNGHVKWTADVRSVCLGSSRNQPSEAKLLGPLLINGDIAIFSENGHVVFLDISTGKLKSQLFYEKVRITRVPIIVDNKLFALTDRAELYAIG